MTYGTPSDFNYPDQDDREVDKTPLMWDALVGPMTLDQ